MWASKGTMNLLYYVGQINRWLPEQVRAIDFLAPLLLRLYLAPIFIQAGANKIDFSTLMPNAGVVQWFAHGLDFPLPTLMAALAGWTELLGGVLLLIGLFTRWASIPLMFTMLVAALAVHWKNGWLAIATADGFFATARTQEAIERLSIAKGLLREHEDYSWLTEHGSFVILNNGIEFAATYFVMLLVLLTVGAGRYLSLDYWIARRCSR